MIELIAVYYFWNRARDVLFERGYEKTLKLQLLVPIFWFGFQIAFWIGYSTVRMLLSGQVARLDIVGYLVCLGGAALGMAILFTILKARPSRMSETERYLRRRRR